MLRAAGCSVFLIFAVCVGTARAEPSYKEGDSLTLSVPAEKLSFDFRVNNTDTRGGVKGPVHMHIKIPIDLGDARDSMNKNKMKSMDFVFIVKKVATTCEKPLFSKECTVNSDVDGFVDQLEATAFGPQITAAMEKDKAARDASKAQASADENAQDSKLKMRAESDTKRCKPFFDKLEAIQKKIKGSQPALTKKYLESGLASKGSSTYAEKVRNEVEMNNFISKNGKGLEKEVIKLVTTKAYQGCPGSATPPDYDYEKYGLKDPTQESE